jgi:hypothetical protein
MAQAGGVSLGFSVWQFSMSPTNSISLPLALVASKVESFAELYHYYRRKSH